MVFVACDDQAWFHFGFMGSTDFRTPNLDRLASQSAVFTRGYVPSSVCRPSLATMITGHYPQDHRLGVGIDGLRAGPQIVRRRFERFSPLPKILQQSGYLSLQTGKWWEGDYRLAGFTHGMTTGTPVPGSVGANEDPATGHKGLGPLDRGMLYLAGGEGLRIGREGLEPIYNFIRNRSDRPFFLWYAPMMPHTSLKEAALSDGTYRETALGYSGDIKLTVKIEGGKIADIRVQHQEKIDQNACKLIPQHIIEQQSLQVDAISGATVTKDAILAGTLRALKKAELK